MHFFQDLVEMDIFYMAIYPDREGVFFNAAWMDSRSNRLADLAAGDSHFAEMVHVCDVKETDLRLLSDVVTQQLICFTGGMKP
jgi:hypothetical protein